MPSLDPDDREELLINHPREWSALSVALATGTLVVYNPTHDAARINNSLCHELSHLILEHEHGRMVTFGDCVMREFDNRQEEEADWLAGSLPVPEAALKRAKFAGLTNAQTAAPGRLRRTRSLALERQRYRPLPRPAPLSALNPTRATRRHRAGPPTYGARRAGAKPRLNNSAPTEEPTFAHEDTAGSKRPHREPTPTRWAIRDATQRCTPMTNLIAEPQFLGGFRGAVQNSIDKCQALTSVSASHGFVCVGTAGFEPTTP